MAIVAVNKRKGTVTYIPTTKKYPKVEKRVYPDIEYIEDEKLVEGILGEGIVERASMLATQVSIGEPLHSKYLIKAMAGSYPNACNHLRSESLEITAEVDEATLAYLILVKE